MIGLYNFKSVAMYWSYYLNSLVITLWASLLSIQHRSLINEKVDSLFLLISHHWALITPIQLQWVTLIIHSERVCPLIIPWSSNIVGFNLPQRYLSVHWSLPKQATCVFWTLRRLLTPSLWGLFWGIWPVATRDSVPVQLLVGWWDFGSVGSITLLFTVEPNLKF